MLSCWTSSAAVRGEAGDSGPDTGDVEGGENEEHVLEM